MFFLIGSIFFGLFLLTIVGVPWLFLRMWRSNKNLERIIQDNSWRLSKEVTYGRPIELEKETLSNLAQDDDDHYILSISRRIDGRYRDRDFFIISYGQHTRVRRSSSGSGSTYIFTKLSDEPRFPPMFAYIKSGTLDGPVAVDSAAKASSGNLRTFQKISLPASFSDIYSVRGLKGTREFQTPEVQEAILAAPHMFRRPREKWYRRFGKMPGLTERFAFLDIQSLDVQTLTNRLDSLMGWVEIVETAHISGTVNS